MCPFQLAENELILPQGLQEIAPFCWAGQLKLGHQTGAVLAKVAALGGEPWKGRRTGRVSGRRMAAPPHLSLLIHKHLGRNLPLQQTYGSCSHKHTHAYLPAHKQTSNFVNKYPTAPPAPPPDRHYTHIRNHRTYTHGHIQTHTWAAYTRTQVHTHGCIMGNSHAHVHLGGTHCHTHAHVGTQAYMFAHKGTRIHTLSSPPSALR